MSVADVSAVLERYRTAIIAGDRGCLDELLDDDYQFISARGGVVGREQRLTALVAGHGHLADLAFSNVQIRLVAGVAVVRAHFRADFRPVPGVPARIVEYPRSSSPVVLTAGACTTSTTATSPDTNVRRRRGASPRNSPHGSAPSKRRALPP